MKKIKVLLLGGWQESGPIIIKHFKNHPRYSFFVADRWKYNASRFSRHCLGFFLLPDFADDQQAYLQQLIENYHRYEIDLILPIPQDELILISKNKQRLLKAGLRFLVPDYEQVDLVVDKYRLAQHLADHSIAYPATYCLSESSGENILAAQRLPLITKLRRGTGQRDQRISNDREGFLRHLETLCIKYPREEIIVQQFIPGLETEAMYTVGALADQHSRLITIVPTKKVRSRPYTGGSGVCVKTVADADVIQICKRTISSIDRWVGIMDIEVKKDPCDNKLYLIEINPRPWGTPMFSVLLAGVNIIELWIKTALGERIEQVHDFRAGIYSVDLINDYLLFTDLVKDLFGTDRNAALKTLKSYAHPYFSNNRLVSLSSCMDFDICDPLPFFFKLFRVRKNLFYSFLPTNRGRKDRF